MVCFLGHFNVNLWTTQTINFLFQNLLKSTVDLIVFLHVLVLVAIGYSNDGYGGGGGADRDSTSSPGGRSNSQLARAGTVRKNINR